jgi:hypothetical protein
MNIEIYTGFNESTTLFFVKNAETPLRIAWFWTPETATETNNHGCMNTVLKHVECVKVSTFHIFLFSFEKKT